MYLEVLESKFISTSFPHNFSIANLLHCMLFFKLPQLWHTWRRWSLPMQCWTSSGPTWGTQWKPKSSPNSFWSDVPNRKPTNRDSSSRYAWAQSFTSWNSDIDFFSLCGRRNGYHVLRWLLSEHSKKRSENIKSQELGSCVKLFSMKKAWF